MNVYFTSPQQIYSIAQLFHLNPKDYKTARILDLNMVPNGTTMSFAYHFKEAQVVGIIEAGPKGVLAQTIIDKFELTNITLWQKSILDIDASLGMFDYIVCEGLYSYVPEAVRDKIMAICRDHLAPNGIISINYNTLPGWNMRRSIREMMRYHVASMDTVEKKVQEARALLNFLMEGIGNENTTYARFLKQEMQILSHYSDHELYHQYLGDINYACYFYEFIAKATKYELSYVSDSYLPLMFPGNLKEKFKTEFDHLQDVLLIVQYLDFIRNQTMRNTLLCHQNKTVNRTLNIEEVMSSYIAYAGLYNQTITKKSLAPNRLLEFEIAGAVPLKISLTDTLSKIAMKVLYDQEGKPISYPSLVKKTVQASGASEAQVHDLFHGDLNLARLLLTGMIKIYPDKGFYPTTPANKPKTTPFIQAIAQMSDQVPNMLNEIYILTPIDRLLLQFINGEKTTPQILVKFEAIMIQKVENKEFTLRNQEGQPLADKKEIIKQIKKLTKASLENLIKNAYLA